MLSKQFRFSLRTENRLLKKEGRKWYGPFFGLVSRQNHLPNPRFCVLVGKKLSKKAVVRNQTKRKIHEVIRKILPTIRNNYDFLFIPKSDIEKLDSKALEVEIIKALSKQSYL